MNDNGRAGCVFMRVLFIVVTFLACSLLLWKYIDGSLKKHVVDGTLILGPDYNLIWIVVLVGLLIWSIADYLHKSPLSIDQKKGAGDKKKSVVSNKIAMLIISLVILSTCALLHWWDIIEKHLGVSFYLVWLVPIGLLGLLVIKYLDEVSISKKGYRYREDNKKHKVRIVWYLYRKLGEMENRIFRSTMIGTFFLLFSVFVMKMYGELPVPFRGEESKWIDILVTYLSFFLFVALLFFVVDAARHCVRFIELIMGKGITWSEETRRKFGIIPSIDGIATDYWLKIKLIADRTEAVNKLINYPIWVILFIFVSYSTYFDNWFVPLSLYLLFGISLSIPILCGFLLRKEAIAAKVVALDALNKELISQTGAAYLEYNTTDLQQSVIDQLNLLISEVNGIRKGAFVPFFQQPFVQSMVYLLGIIGAVLSQYFANRY